MVRGSYLSQQAWWSQVRSLCVPNKVKMFVWKACKNLLHVMSILCRRKVIEDAWCPVCNDGYKDISHSLWKCKNILPVLSILCREKVVEDAWYPVCNGGYEDIPHSLWKCSLTIKV